MKINLGCDIYPIEGFINVDMEPKVNPDVCMDILSYLKSLEDNTVDEVYAGHVLEHFTTEESIEMLKEIHRVLIPGGLLTAVIPDTEKGIKEYREGHITLEWLNQIVFGSQVRTGQSHKQVFTESILVEVLSKVFTEVSALDIKEVDLAVSQIGWQSAAKCIKS